MKNRMDDPRSGAEIPWDELAAPAQRALSGAGFARLEDLAQVSEGQVKKLHGIGPRALVTLRAALAEAGLSFRSEADRRD
jgi:hypothetical protein